MNVDLKYLEKYILQAQLRAVKETFREENGSIKKNTKTHSIHDMGAPDFFFKRAQNKKLKLVLRNSMRSCNNSP